MACSNPRGPALCLVPCHPDSKSAADSPYHLVVKSVPKDSVARYWANTEPQWRMIQSVNPAGIGNDAHDLATRLAKVGIAPHEDDVA